MKLISHRGNLFGPNKLENKQSYILDAVSCGYDVEIDVWFDGGWWLGHDEPKYRTNIDWINKYGDEFWVHCKNLEALHKLLVNEGQYCNLNFFWHQQDDFTVTNHGWIWAYPGKPLTDISICVLPERSESPYETKVLKNCAGICSDYIDRYRDL